MEEDKKKRGRRPKTVYNVESVNTTTLSDDENIIVRLNVTDDVKPMSSAISYSDDDDEQPYAYNVGDYSQMQKIGSFHEVNIQEEQTECLPDNCCRLRVVDLLKDFKEKNKQDEWPQNTTIACYWCCHKFNTTPFGIPIEYIKDPSTGNEKFNVIGCFCSLECAAAYNFNNTKNQDDVWERYNLINLLSRRIGYKNIIKTAPDRMSLKLFGGFMDINDFRNYCVTSRVLHTNLPPMMSVTQQIEEINEHDLNNKIRYIPIDNDRINRYKEKVLFKRNKSVGPEKSMLEHAMNMKIVSP